MLDPRMCYPNELDTSWNEEMSTKGKLSCPFLDREQAFIPILINTVKTVSGWPDMVAPTYTTPSGMRKEQWGIVDGAVDILESFDIDISFRNIREEPGILLFSTWMQYMSAVFEGMMMPYLDMITENEIDYNTRIYRLVMDPTNTIVKKIACTGASFPVSVPTGKFFDYSDDKPFSEQTKDYTIRFKCFGAMYDDAILVKEFNETVSIFNPSMRKVNLVNGGDIAIAGLEKIPTELLPLMKNRGYPRINTDTNELEWWVKTGYKLNETLSKDEVTKVIGSAWSNHM